MAEYNRLQYTLSADHEDLRVELPNTPALPAHRHPQQPPQLGHPEQHSSSDVQSQPRGPTIPPTLRLPACPQAPKVGPVPTTSPPHYKCGSEVFYIQEREFLSRPAIFRLVTIEIDLPNDPRAIGGSYQPLQFVTARQTQPSQPPSLPTPSGIPTPPQHQSLSEYRMHQVCCRQDCHYR